MNETPVLDAPSRDDQAQQRRAERLASVGALAGGMAHDLNNILTPILMSIRLLDEQIDDADSRRLLAVLEGSAKRGATMVRQIQALSRGLDRPSAAIDLRSVLEDLRHLVAGTFPRSIELIVEIAPGVTAINGDPAHLQQVLVNLCINARNAMPAGGRLVLRAEPVELGEAGAAAIPDGRPGRYVVLSVADTGSGAWSNVSSSRAIVRTFGGFLEVKNDIGRGTAVQMFFPAPAPGLAADEQSPLPVSLRGHDELILVVDDEASVRSITSQVLSAYGYRVITAANGADAVAEFAKRPHEIAAVLTGTMMAGMDGGCTMHALQTIDPGVKLIAARALDAGATGDTPGAAAVLPKPYRAETLLAVLRQVLDD